MLVGLVRARFLGISRYGVRAVAREHSAGNERHVHHVEVVVAHVRGFDDDRFAADIGRAAILRPGASEPPRVRSVRDALDAGTLHELGCEDVHRCRLGPRRGRHHENVLVREAAEQSLAQVVALREEHEHGNDQEARNRKLRADEERPQRLRARAHRPQAQRGDRAHPGEDERGIKARDQRDGADGRGKKDPERQLEPR